MPQNKRESFVFTVMMCFVMVLVMSIYNTAMAFGGISGQSIQAAWLGFPIAYGVAMACDWFLVSNSAKKFAFRYWVNPQDSQLRKALCISCAMVIPMVILMSLYGTIEHSLHTGQWDMLLQHWVRNIGLNVIVALPLQLLIAGPLVRKGFAKIFPFGLAQGA